MSLWPFSPGLFLSAGGWRSGGRKRVTCPQADTLTLFVNEIRKSFGMQAFYFLLFIDK